MKVVVFEGWGKVRSSILHRCPDVSPRVQLSHQEAKPPMFCSSVLPFPHSYGESNSSRLRIISLQARVLPGFCLLTFS